MNEMRFLTGPGPRLQARSWEGLSRDAEHGDRMKSEEEKKKKKRCTNSQQACMDFTDSYRFWEGQ